MEAVSRAIYLGESVAEIEQEIASISEVFALQNLAELTEAKKRYLPSPAANIP